jgi:peroxiredoxin
MKTRGTVVAALALVAALAQVALAGGIGERVGAFDLQDERGQRRALGDYQGKTLVVIVWGASCPTSAGYAQRLQALAQRFGGRVELLGLAVEGDATAVGQAKQRQGLGFPIAIDAGGRVAQGLGAGVTPTALVIDGQGTLRYRGAIDDDPAGARAGSATPYLQQAIDAVLAGRAPPQTETRAVGRPIR